MGKRILLIVLLIIIAVAGILILNKQERKESAYTIVPITPTISPKSNELQNIIIDEVGLSMHVPREFIFGKQQQMNLTTNEAYAVSFTVQNYKDNPTQVTKPYQLYGIYQWDTGVTTPEAFAASDFMLTESTRQEFTVAGLPAIKGVSAGERGRYTIYVLKDGHILTLAADGSDEEHIRITDEILESIRLTK